MRAYEWGGNFLEDARKKLNRETIRPRRSRFSIGSAPLTSITKSDAQISGGETRQDYKDTRRFPLAAPSCALLFLPFGLPVSFRCYGRGFSFHARHSAPGRQFAPSWTVCTNPPFSPTAAPYPVTIVLSPTRKDTTKRHWQQPLVTGLAERVNVDGAIEFLKWWPNYGYTGRTVFGICALLKPVTTVRRSARIFLPSKNRLPRRFFRLQSKRLRRDKKDHKKILSLLQTTKSDFSNAHP